MFVHLQLMVHKHYRLATRRGGVKDDGGMFKYTFQYEPYFRIASKVRYLLLSFHALIQ